jgi:hypothetical protein
MPAQNSFSASVLRFRLSVSNSFSLFEDSGNLIEKVILLFSPAHHILLTCSLRIPIGGAPREVVSSFRRMFLICSLHVPIGGAPREVVSSFRRMFLICSLHVPIGGSPSEVAVSLCSLSPLILKVHAVHLHFHQ